ncbi:MAG: phosphate ABC transporter permease subunit PstC, partial [Kovacikia sp.]
MATQVQTGTTQPEAIQPRTFLESSLDRVFVWVTRIFALAVAGILIWIAVEVAIDAAPAIQRYGWSFLVDSGWNPVEDEYGALPVIYGTLVSSAISLLFAIPIGVGTAIFLSENFIPSTLRTGLIFLVELLAAIPSVVYGLWGIYVLIPLLKPIGNWLHGNLNWLPIFSTPYIGPGMFPAGIILTVMILPIITAISRDSLSSVDPSLRQASM